MTDFGDLRSESEKDEVDLEFLGDLLLNGSENDIAYFLSKKPLSRISQLNPKLLYLEKYPSALRTPGLSSQGRIDRS